MPCSDPFRDMPSYNINEGYSTPQYVTREVIVDNQETIHELNKQKRLVGQLEASFCAVLTELEKLGIVNQVLQKASRNGLMNLVELWENHKKDDESRISKDLLKYSKHELELIKKILE